MKILCTPNPFNISWSLVFYYDHLTSGELLIHLTTSCFKPSHQNLPFRSWYIIMVNSKCTSYGACCALHRCSLLMSSPFDTATQWSNIGSPFLVYLIFHQTNGRLLTFPSTGAWIVIHTLALVWSSHLPLLLGISSTKISEDYLLGYDISREGILIGVL